MEGYCWCRGVRTFGWRPLEAEGRAEACRLLVGVRRRGAGGFLEADERPGEGCARSGRSCRVVIVGADGGMWSAAGWGIVAPLPVGELLTRCRPDIDGDWREVAIDGAGGGIVAPPPALIGGDWRGCSPHAATLLIGARKANGRLGGGVGVDGLF